MSADRSGFHFTPIKAVHNVKGTNRPNRLAGCFAVLFLSVVGLFVGLLLVAALGFYGRIVYEVFIRAWGML